MYLIAEFISYILITAGLYCLFKKCQINPKWAFVPIYRFYLLADFIDMDEEGITRLNADIIANALSLFSYTPFYATLVLNHKRTIWILSLVSLVFSIVSIIYGLRIFIAFSRKFKIKRSHRSAWGFLWAFFPYIPALIWGFSSKYQPSQEQEIDDSNAHTAEVSGIDVPVLKQGLTINLTDRSIKAHMKKRYLLRDIHMSIQPGNMILLLGGSGAGKTTFLNAITGYEPANARIDLDGEDVYSNFNKMKYKIGFVPQQDLIRYEDTVEKTLLDAASLRLPTDCSSEEKHKRVKEVLEIFGLTPVRENIVSKQSGGQKKRISIATEFISDPSLFILDEPDSGLDGILARDLMRRLHEISRQGKIVIVITHTPDRVIDLFDEVIVLGKDANRTGRLVFYGSIDQARDFFQVTKMEDIIRKINCKDEGGEGLSDTLIEKYAEVCHAE